MYPGTVIRIHDPAAEEENKKKKDRFTNCDFNENGIHVDIAKKLEEPYITKNKYLVDDTEEEKE